MKRAYTPWGAVLGILLFAAWATSQAAGQRASAAATSAPAATASAAARPDTAAERIDPAEVQRKIAGLAIEDETLPYDQRPEVWLHVRRDRILPQLIAALDDANSKVAYRCLYYTLRDCPENKDFEEALLRKAGDANSSLRYLSLYYLEKYASDDRVIKLFDQASTEAALAEPTIRARWAILGRQKDRAVDVVKPLLAKAADSSLSYDAIMAVRILGDSGSAKAVPLLAPLAAGDRWELAAEAYLALAKADPNGHPLTKDQIALLEETRHGYKETTEHRRERVLKLAALNVKEIRPLAMQMLRTGGESDALVILAAWKDREALPEIWSCIESKDRPYHRREGIAAYLAIDANSQAEHSVLSLLKKDSSDEFANEVVLWGIASADIPAARSLSLLRSARDVLRDSQPLAVPRALRCTARDGKDIATVLPGLMDEESSLKSLGEYCELAAADKDKRFAQQVLRAANLLSTAPDVLRPSGGGLSREAQQILSAASDYKLKDAIPAVQKLTGSTNPEMAVSAQAAAARLGVAGALEALYSQIGDQNAEVRGRAAAALRSIPPADEKERAAREEVLLAQLGKPSEEAAIGVLVICGRAKTIQALSPRLDDADLSRALYASWVLAQLPDKDASAKGLRRIAICAMFNHQMYQQGAGIDFPIAAGVYFHQSTGGRGYSQGQGPVQIPPDLLKAFPLEGNEVDFAVRAYRQARDYGYELGSRDGILGLRNWSRGQAEPDSLDRSYLPLLKAMTTEDTDLHRLMVQNRPVAHFHCRQMAAQAIAAITKEKATYVGLAGETLDSEASPQPYKDQEALLARFVVDQIEKAHLPSPQDWTDLQRQRAARLDRMVRIAEQAGAEYDDKSENLARPRILDAIRAEARSRGVDTRQMVPERNN